MVFDKAYVQCVDETEHDAQQVRLHEASVLIYSKAETPHCDVAEHYRLDRLLDAMCLTADEYRQAKDISDLCFQQEDEWDEAKCQF